MELSDWSIQCGHMTSERDLSDWGTTWSFPRGNDVGTTSFPMGTTSFPCITTQETT